MMKSKLKTLFLICVVLATLAAAPAAGFCAEASSGPVDNPDFELMDRYIQDMMKDCRIPGLSIGIIKGTDVLKIQGYGRADDTGRLVTAQTPFLIGSISKTFTALAVLQLAEAGKINLDKPVQTYLPDFRLADSQAAGIITVRQLLNHTSGIAVNAEFRVASLHGDESVHELVSRFGSIKPVAQPGTRFEYGNVNYIILGDLIQAVSGLSYEEYLQKNIFDPLEMSHSFTSADMAKANGLADGYLSLFGFPQASNLTYRTDFLPAYSIISCSEDMTHYMLAMLNGGQYKNTRILSEQGIQEMTSASAEISKWLSYGLGWHVTSGSVYHGGDVSDYQAQVKILPQDGLGVVLMYNTSGSTAVTLFNVGYRDKLEGGIINVLYGVPPTVQPGQSPLNLNSYPMSLTYALMLGLVILVCLLFVLSFLRLRSLRRRLAKSKSAFWRIALLSLVINVALPIILLVATPAKAGATWSFVLYFIPDLGWTLLIASILLFILGALKGVQIAKYLVQRHNGIALPPA